jgi:4-alpha-glucanotransferase
LTQVASDELSALRRLAQLHHVQTSYIDVYGRRAQASHESLLAVLKALGAGIENSSEARPALQERRRDLWRWHLEPVVVAWDGVMPPVELRLPASQVRGTLEIELALEGGASVTNRVRLEDMQAAARSTIGGDDFVAVRLPVHRLDAAANLPLGYHRLTLRCGSRELDSLVIAAPRLAYRPPQSKRWGVFLPLYALRSARSWGVGDFTDLEGLMAWAQGQGAGFVGTLPMLASFLDQPFEPSPYMPVSRCFWNELYMDIGPPVTVGKAGVNEYGAVLAAAAEEASRLNARETVPYQEAMALKRRVLRELTRRFSLQDPAHGVVQGFLMARPAIKDYAAFRAALEASGGPWYSWPEPQRSGVIAESDYNRESFEYHALAQAVCDEQVVSLAQRASETGVCLYLDLPVGVHPEGYDAWRHQQQFVEGMSVGAPPDPLAYDGQNWGFRPLNVEATRKSGYEYAREYLGHHMRAAGILRVDHAIGLHRLFWIPEGASGRDGVFVRQPAEETYALLSLESHRNQCVVVGENLGLVPPEVNQGLGRHGIDRMYVQLFEMTGDSGRPLNPVPRDSMASFSTHDLPTFAAFWSDKDLRARQRMGLLDEDGLHRVCSERAPLKSALAAHLKSCGLIDEEPSMAQLFEATTQLAGESDADWLMVNLEDAWQETNSQNVPGTLAETHPNWRRRARLTLEQIGEARDITSLTAVLRRVRPKHAGDSKEDEAPQHD